MLVGETLFHLIGYLSASDKGIGFVIPIFINKLSNMIFIQEIRADGSISGFKQIDSKKFFNVEKYSKDFKVDDQSLWGFRNSDEQVIFELRDEMRKILYVSMENFEDPLIRLQISEFCEDTVKTIKGWRESFSHLASLSVKSAEAWRDVVVVPSQMRQAVSRAIIDCQINIKQENLDKTVDIEIAGGKILLYLSRSLYSNIVTNKEAVATIERSSVPLKQAFSLSSSEVELKIRSSDGGIDHDLQYTNVAIAGFGDMAASVISEFVPRTVRMPGSRMLGQLPSPRGANSMVLLQKDELEGRSDWGAPNAPLELHHQNELIIFVFQVGKKLSDLTIQAISFAQKNRNENRKMVAVIPHFISELANPNELANSIIPSLHGKFDALWMLSDRSPYTRQPLPFGPARSVAVAGNHFRYFMSLAQNKEFMSQIISERASNSSINVIGSAVGTQPIPKLAEHALLRLSHNLFNFRNTKSIHFVCGDTRSLQAYSVRKIVDFFAPQATITVSKAANSSYLQDQVTVIAKDVLVLEDNEENFEKYCLENLSRFGWSIIKSDSLGIAIISKSIMTDIYVRFKYMRGAKLDSKSKADIKKNHLDSVIITNAAISASVFTEYVLSGCVPIHHSRLNVLDRIYKKRYVYALSYIRKGKDAERRLAIQSAIKWFMSNCLSDIEQIHNTKISIGSNITVNIGYPYTMELIIPFSSTYAPVSKSPNIIGKASIRLDSDGWAFEGVKFGP